MRRHNPFKTPLAIIASCLGIALSAVATVTCWVDQDRACIKANEDCTYMGTSGKVYANGTSYHQCTEASPGNDDCDNTGTSVCTYSCNTGTAGSPSLHTVTFNVDTGPSLSTVACP